MAEPSANTRAVSEMVLAGILSIVRNYSGIRALTCGIEHEFFLINEAQDPASHCQSQCFLRDLAREPGWSIRREGADVLGEMIWSVCRQVAGGRFSAVKYDHHPHLLEIATAYHSNLWDLLDELSSVFVTIDTIARKNRLRISHAPDIGQRPCDLAVTSQLSSFAGLREYRERLYMKRGECPDEFVNYAAVIAATQVHIGGVAWWIHPHIVQQLYLVEPYICTSTYHELDESVRRKRWEGYARVFRGYPLLGFPQMDQWTLMDWADALVRSPLAGPPGWKFAGETLQAIGLPDGMSVRAFIDSVRDLQIIKPRIFGTIEFRSDPAATSACDALRSAATRVGITQAIVDGFRLDSKFCGERDLWWSWTLGKGEPSKDHTDALLATARKALKGRLMREERLLDR